MTQNPHIPPETVYLNGRFLPLAEAAVGVLDRGFLFGDGVYEVLPVYGGTPFYLDRHLARLAQSLEGVRIQNPLSPLQWGEMVGELIGLNGGGNLSVYLQVTRGAAKRDHAFPPDAVPTVFAMGSPLPPRTSGTPLQGMAAITLPDIRWLNCHIKAITLLPNVLMRQQAVEEGAAEAILLRDGMLTEASASNVFVVRDGLVATPPLSRLILPGITRGVVLDLLADQGIGAVQEPVTEAGLRTADEVWVTSSLREIAPVTRLDGAPVGDGRPGPVFEQMDKAFQTLKTQPRLWSGEKP